MHIYQTGPIPWQMALQIATAVSEALLAAHSKGIIHRALKPSSAQWEEAIDWIERARIGLDAIPGANPPK